MDRRDQDREQRINRNQVDQETNDSLNEVRIVNPETLKYNKLMKFSEGDFPPYFEQVFKQFGFNSTTPIQQHCIPVAMEYNDVIGIAQTGSGKTLAFVVPAIIMILEEMRVAKEAGKQWNNNGKPKVLILAPTRELANQIHSEAIKFVNTQNIRIVLVYGGARSFPQKNDLRSGVDLLIATPGRLIDFIHKGFVNLEDVVFLVLDEADRMLDMGFMPQVNEINSHIKNQHRQTLLLSATWPKEVEVLSKGMIKPNAVKVIVGNDDLTSNKNIEQRFIFCDDFREKKKRMRDIIRNMTISNTSKVLIFINTKKDCNRMESELNTDGFKCRAIHGDKSQEERDEILGNFKKGDLNIVIATDVASRGLDIKTLRNVVNYDFPQQIEDYIHRIGRTGRAGCFGTATSFMGSKDNKHSRKLVEILKKNDQKVPPKLMQNAGGSYYGGDSDRRYHTNVNEAKFDREEWERKREELVSERKAQFEGQNGGEGNNNGGGGGFGGGDNGGNRQGSSSYGRDNNSGGGSGGGSWNNNNGGGSQGGNGGSWGGNSNNQAKSNNSGGGGGWGDSSANQAVESLGGGGGGGW